MNPGIISSHIKMEIKTLNIHMQRFMIHILLWQRIAGVIQREAFL